MRLAVVSLLPRLTCCLPAFVPSAVLSPAPMGGLRALCPVSPSLCSPPFRRWALCCCVVVLVCVLCVCGLCGLCCMVYVLCLVCCCLRCCFAVLCCVVLCCVVLCCVVLWFVLLCVDVLCLVLSCFVLCCVCCSCCCLFCVVCVCCCVCCPLTARPSARPPPCFLCPPLLCPHVSTRLLSWHRPRPSTHQTSQPRRALTRSPRAWVWTAETPGRLPSTCLSLPTQVTASIDGDCDSRRRWLRLLALRPEPLPHARTRLNPRKRFPERGDSRIQPH